MKIYSRELFNGLHYVTVETDREYESIVFKPKATPHKAYNEAIKTLFETINQLIEARDGKEEANES